MFTNDEILNLLAMMSSDENDKQLAMSIVENSQDKFTNEHKQLILLCTPYDWVFATVHRLRNMNVGIDNNKMIYKESFEYYKSNKWKTYDELKSHLLS